MKLNQAHRPCQPSPDYDYAQCLHRSIIMKAGCQPHWRLYSVKGMPTCSNISALNQFQRIMWNISINMDVEEVLLETKCLMPCTYMEYKVSLLRDETMVNGLMYICRQFCLNTFIIFSKLYFL